MTIEERLEVVERRLNVLEGAFRALPDALRADVLEAISKSKVSVWITKETTNQHNAPQPRCAPTTPATG